MLRCYGSTGATEGYTAAPTRAKHARSCDILWCMICMLQSGWVTMTAAFDHFVDVAHRIRESAAALGDALDAVQVYAEPAVARAVQAERNLYDRIDAEFGLLTSAETGRRLGSRSTAPRNLAAATRRDGALLAITRGHQMLFPGFQFDPDGRPLPVIRILRDLADETQWSETGIVQWLCAPTTYLGGLRPVDLLASEPDRVVDTARRAWTVQW